MFGVVDTPDELHKHIMPPLKESIPLIIPIIRNGKLYPLNFFKKTTLSKFQHNCKRRNIKRYIEKKTKHGEKPFIIKKNVKYEYRSIQARSRPRVGGKFVSLQDENILRGLHNDKKKYDEYVKFIKRKLEKSI